MINIKNESFTNSIVVFLHAHPDDESFLTAGILQYLLKIKVDVRVIYLAAGIVKNETKTVLRQNEAATALKLLGVNQCYFINTTEPKYIGTPGATPLVNQSDRKICARIINTLAMIKSRKKLTLFSYERNGGYGNQDHIKTHKAGRNLPKLLKGRISAFYETTINRDKYNLWLKKNLPLKDITQLPKLSYWTKQFGSSTNEITHEIKLSQKETNLKRQALALHHSQIKQEEFPLSLDLKNFIYLFGTEYFTKVL